MSTLPDEMWVAAGGSIDFDDLNLPAMRAFDSRESAMIAMRGFIRASRLEGIEELEVEEARIDALLINSEVRPGRFEYVSDESWLVVEKVGVFQYHDSGFKSLALMRRDANINKEIT